MDFKEIGLEVVEWIHMAQGRDQWCRASQEELCVKMLANDFH
jgi:hypothetical protein